MLSQAKPIFIAYSITDSLLFGRVPGWPSDIGLVWEFGEDPNTVESLQYALVLVDN
jgi:hypothetical protein